MMTGRMSIINTLIVLMKRSHHGGPGVVTIAATVWRWTRKGHGSIHTNRFFRALIIHQTEALKWIKVMILGGTTTRIVKGRTALFIWTVIIVLRIIQTVVTMIMIMIMIVQFRFIRFSAF